MTTGEILEAGPRDGEMIAVPGDRLKVLVQPPGGLHTRYVSENVYPEAAITTITYERRRGLDGRTLFVHPNIIARMT